MIYLINFSDNDIKVEGAKSLSSGLINLKNLDKFDLNL